MAFAKKSSYLPPNPVSHQIPSLTKSRLLPSFYPVFHKIFPPFGFFQDTPTLATYPIFFSTTRHPKNPSAEPKLNQSLSIWGTNFTSSAPHSYPFMPKFSHFTCVLRPINRIPVAKVAQKQIHLTHTTPLQD